MKLILLEKHGKIYKKENYMLFTKEILKKTIDELAAEGKIFSNERQFQLELAMKLQQKGFDVELEVVSSDKSFDELQKLSKEDREKLYTDIIIKQENDKYIAIELKYKTPQKFYIYKTIKGTIITFPQGASDLGAFLFWKDVERLENFKNINLNFDSNKKIEKGYAVLLTNQEDYWSGKKDSLCRNFFPVGNKKGHLNWWVKVDSETQKRVNGRTAKSKCDIIEVTEDKTSLYKSYFDKDGKEKMKDVSPIKLKGNYNCVNGQDYIGWFDYNIKYDATCKDKPIPPKFRYLMLEVEL